MIKINWNCNLSTPRRAEEILVLACQPCWRNRWLTSVIHVAVSPKLWPQGKRYSHRQRIFEEKNYFIQRRQRRTGKFVVLSVAVGKTWLVRARWSRSSPKKTFRQKFLLRLTENNEHQDDQVFHLTLSPLLLPSTASKRFSATCACAVCTLCLLNANFSNKGLSLVSTTPH